MGAVRISRCSFCGSTHTEGDSAAAKAGTCAAGGNGDLVLVAVLHDGCNFFGALYFKDYLGVVDAIDGHFITGIVIGNFSAVEESAGADERLELFCKLRSDLGVLSHFDYLLI
jgi:hypothetical protein